MQQPILEFILLSPFLENGVCHGKLTNALTIDILLAEVEAPKQAFPAAPRLCDVKLVKL